MVQIGVLPRAGLGWAVGAPGSIPSAKVDPGLSLVIALLEPNENVEEPENGGIQARRIHLRGRGETPGVDLHGALARSRSYDGHGCCDRKAARISVVVDGWCCLSWSNEVAVSPSGIAFTAPGVVA